MEFEEGRCAGVWVVCVVFWIQLKPSTVTKAGERSQGKYAVTWSCAISIGWLHKAANSPFHLTPLMMQHELQGGNICIVDILECEKRRVVPVSDHRRSGYFEIPFASEEDSLESKKARTSGLRHGKRSPQATRGTTTGPRDNAEKARVLLRSSSLQMCRAARLTIALFRGIKYAGTEGPIRRQ
jgi:hypothetical protein